MRPGTALLAPALGAFLLTGACASVGKLRTALFEPSPATRTETTAPPPSQTAASAPSEAPPDPQLLRALAGRWSMEAKERGDALVPNSILVLHPDGGLDFLRDNSGGTNFSVRFSGTWAASSLASDRVEVTFNYTSVRPGRVCYPLPGNCETYALPIRESWAFARTGPDTMETPGAVWHRSPLT